MDNLDYDYLGNQLTRVEDATSNAQGFKDVSSAVGTQEYRYDKNGNMISDTNKGISAVTYNYLNLPQQVTLNTGTTIHYTYDAAGIKHQKVVDDGSPDTTTYIGGFHYTNGDLKFLQHAEGRALKSGTIWTYEYNLTDHLGNVRVSVDESGSVVQRDGYYPGGLSFNSSASSPKNNYLYNQGTGEETFKTERQPELGVDFTRYRVYDPALMRFWQVDPKADQANQEGWSPYQYAFNNPISNNDPLGDTVRVYTEQIVRAGIPIARHGFLRVQTDKVDKIVELWGPDGTRTGLPKVFDFSQGQVDGRSGVEEGEVERPEGVPEGDYSFENSILELASFFMEESEANNQDYVNLPDYNALGPNSNGYINALVEMSGGSLDLPSSAIGQDDTHEYERAVKVDEVSNKMQELDQRIQELKAKLNKSKQQE